ncbi:hypothetical protein [Paludibaculum fermentans]|uniref:Uncharacterized protein n=1 Tax=Paludibaculum fermentans TaxID=1473598 RepID=A0A7S7NLK1_PALFE|nr:hypothetical protein [Paludibaculum fermentans]QOY85785.1 hypothetical protein IRI77_23560 [Paludibaculum fermentans]
MIRQFTILAIAATLAAPASWAQRGERKTVDLSRVASKLSSEGTGGTAGAAQFRAAMSRGRSGGGATDGVALGSSGQANATTLAQAPGVLQMNLFEGYKSGRETYFVATRTIPSGSTLQQYIYLPDNQQLALSSVKFSYDIAPGESLALTNVKDFGFFWEYGLTAYAVKITLPDGTETWAGTDFGTADWQGLYYRKFADLPFVIPGLTGAREYLDNGATMVEIKGRFRTDLTAHVIFEDLVVPSNAVQVLDATTIVVNLSQAYGYYYDSGVGDLVQQTFDPTRVRGYLLTVGQGGFTDTLPFRHTPMQ